MCFYENDIILSGVEKFLFMRQFFKDSFYFYIFILFISEDLILFAGIGSSVDIMKDLRLSEHSFGNII